MVRKARALGMTAALLLALGGITEPSRGQAPSGVPVPPPPNPSPAAPISPPPPAPGLPSTPVPIPVPAAPAPARCPAPYCPNMSYGPAGGPPACAPYEDRNGPLLRRDPLLDPPCFSPPGWFGSVELDFVGPHVKNRLNSTVTVDGLGDFTVHLPNANLDWTASPRFEVGYRFPEGFGEVVLGYHSLATEGRQIVPDFDIAGSGYGKSRVNLNSFDLDYASREFSLLPCLDMKWRVGLRFADVYFDSQVSGLVTEERTANTFWGIGPHAGLDLAYNLPDIPGLALFTRLEGATLLGRIKQSYEEVVITDLGLLGGATTNRGSQAVPVLHWQLGVTYAPQGSGDRIRFAAGYELEQWWSIGKLDNSSGELTVNGVFFRMEFNY